MVTAKINGQELTASQILLLRYMLRDLFIFYTNTILEKNEDVSIMRRTLLSIMELFDGHVLRLSPGADELNYRCPIMVNGFVITRIQASYVSEAIQHAWERHLAGESLLPKGTEEDLKTLHKVVCGS